MNFIDGMVSLGWSLKKTIEHLHSVHACVGINDGFKRQVSIDIIGDIKK